jgi:hypothetical protein
MGHKPSSLSEREVEGLGITNDFSKYSVNMTTALKALNLITSEVDKSIDSDVLGELDDEDKEELNKVMEMKVDILVDVSFGCASVKEEYVCIRNRLNYDELDEESKIFTKFDDEEFQKSFIGNVKKINCLQIKIKSLSDNLERKYPCNNKVKKIVGGLSGSMILLGCAVLITLHFIPIINFVLGSAELIALGFIAVGGTSVLVSSIRAREKSRLVTYLDQLNKNLSRLNKILITLKAKHDKLSKNHKNDMKKVLDSLVILCDDVITTCNSV